MKAPTYTVQIRVVETNVSSEAPKPTESYNDETVTIEIPRSVAIDRESLALFLQPVIHTLADALRNT
jgi:hypothetical protein